jgi:hypothetical protein
MATGRWRMVVKKKPEEYRRMAEDLRAVANTTHDPRTASEALKMAEDYDDMAQAAERDNLPPPSSAS